MNYVVFLFCHVVRYLFCATLSHTLLCFAPRGHQMGSCFWGMRRQSESGAQEVEDMIDENINTNNQKATDDFSFSAKSDFTLSKDNNVILLQLDFSPNTLLQFAILFWWNIGVCKDDITERANWARAQGPKGSLKGLLTFLVGKSQSSFKSPGVLISFYCRTRLESFNIEYLPNKFVFVYFLLRITSAQHTEAI